MRLVFTRENFDKLQQENEELMELTTKLTARLLLESNKGTSKPRGTVTSTEAGTTKTSGRKGRAA